MYSSKNEKKKRHPVWGAMVTALSVAGVVGIFRSCKKNAVKAADKMKSWFSAKGGESEN